MTCITLEVSGSKKIHIGLDKAPDILELLIAGNRLPKLSGRHYFTTDPASATDGKQHQKQASPSVPEYRYVVFDVTIPMDQEPVEEFRL